MQLTPSIFKAYDIRGTTPTTINEAVAEALGLAFGTEALAQGERTVAVGRDGRLSGPALGAAVSASPPPASCRRWRSRPRSSSTSRPS